MNRQVAYAELVAKRKNCNRCNDPELKNPATIKNGVFDSDHIGPWSRWQGNLNAEIMVVGQDWGGVEYFTEKGGDDKNSGNPTEANLRKLLEVFGLHLPVYGEEQEQVIFLTNLVLCMKNGGLQAPIKDCWLSNCSEEFFKQLVDIIKPKIIVALGKKVSESILLSYSRTKSRSWTLSKLMENSPYCLTDSTYIFPVYHCGAGGVNRNRKLDAQRKDWERIAEWYSRHKGGNNHGQ